MGEWVEGGVSVPGSGWEEGVRRGGGKSNGFKDTAKVEKRELEWDGVG